MPEWEQGVTSGNKPAKKAMHPKVDREESGKKEKKDGKKKSPDEHGLTPCCRLLLKNHNSKWKTGK